MEKDEILYHPLARSSSSSSSSDSGDERVEIITVPQRRRRCGSHCMVFFSSACLMASIAICVFTLAYKSQLATDANCTRRMSTYSPLIEDDLIRYHPRQYEGDFFKPSIYRGQPTLEKEEAWLGLWDHGPLVIPMDDLPKLNKTKDLPWLMAPPEYGESVISTLEVHHQLHCLSTLRHWAYREEVLALPGEPPELLTLDKRIVWEHLGTLSAPPSRVRAAPNLLQITASRCCASTSCA
jgi:Mycotoxin biosynthesis protein UstYa